MRSFTLLALFIGISMTGYSQLRTRKISGNVIDGSAKTIESSTITLLNAKDSSVVKIGVADKNGHFEFENIGDGRYLVSISAVGHEKGYSETFEVTPEKTSVDLKTIQLVALAKNLTGVTVVARKPFIEQKLDRTVVNVDAAITNVGTSALEVLEKSPGVTIDKDGN